MQNLSPSDLNIFLLNQIYLLNVVKFLFSSIFTGLSHSAKMSLLLSQSRAMHFLHFIHKMEFDLLRDCVLC